MFYDPTFILLVPAMIFAFYAQAKVASAYKKYAGVRNLRRMTGQQAARMLLDNNGLSDVRIEVVGGHLTDHYDPRGRVMRLSQQVYGEASIASVSIAAHETGHAIQHSIGYIPLKIRNSIVPAVNLCSWAAWPLVMIGILISSTGNHGLGGLIMTFGIFFFLGVVIFHLITLPVELDASRRAVREMERYGIITSDEVKGAKKVLGAAALTYLAALATALANLLRLLAIRGREQ